MVIGFRRPTFAEDLPLDRTLDAVCAAVQMLLPLLFLLLLSALPAASSDQKAIPIHEAVRDLDRDFVPVRLEESVTLTGILISDPVILGTAASLVNLQDDTGGIVLFTPDTSVLVGHFKRGDVVEVQGNISQYKGQEQLLIEQIWQLGTRPVPPPRDVLAADLLHERYEGQLVRVVGELLVLPDQLDKGRGAVLRDRSGEIPVYISSRFFSNPKFAERLVKGGSIEIVGVVGQEQAQPPYNSGYRLIPRDPDDFHFAPIPPYRAMAITLALALLAGLTFNFWLRRRIAERRARAMATLTSNLRRSEEALRERTTYLNALIENSPLAIVVLDLQDQVQMCNPAFERLFLYRQEEIVGSQVNDLIRTGDNPSELEEISRRVLAGEVVHITTRRGRRDGTSVDVELHGVPLIVHGTPAGSYGLYQNITERKTLENQLNQAQKMEAVGRLAGGLAHDFNNLLMVIKGHVELLQESLGSSDSQQRHVKRIQMAADRAAALIQQLLAYSRRQVIEPTVIDLNRVLGDMGKMLPRLLGEDIELVSVPNPALGRVKADRNQIEQVVMNLAVNARDAMPNGGKLTIETANVELDESYSRKHAGVRPGPYVMLAVSDTGTGMDPVTQSHIFEPFFTTKDSGKGTGLGLATVYGIIRQNEGHIWLYSELGHGTTFKIYLPQVQGALEGSPAEDASREMPQGSGTVLLVEDEEAVRELVREILQRNGYTVLEAKHGAEALQIAERHPGAIQLMVTDIVMPGMNGRELARRLARRYPSMKILYMSGFAENAIVHHGVLDPGTIFLQKPFSPNDLAQKALELLGSTSPVKT